jgi:hypothetical protein
MFFNTSNASFFHNFLSYFQKDEKDFSNLVIMINFAENIMNSYKAI